MWIGINNINATEAAARLDALLAWMQGAMPLTRLVVQAPPPQNWYPGRSAELLKVYRPMLNRRGVELSTCGSGLNPGPSPANNTTTYMDGLHLLAPGYRVVFACLKPRLAALRAMQARKRGIPLGGAGRR